MRERRPVHGYGQVFEETHEIQSVPNKGRNTPLPVPVPVRSIGYFFALMALMAILRHLPVVPPPLGLLKPLVAYIVLPLAGAILLTKLEPYGRPATHHVHALIRDRVMASRTCLGRPVRPAGQPAVIESSIVFAIPPVEGPAAITFAEPTSVIVRQRRAGLLRRGGDLVEVVDARRVELDDDEVLTVVQS